MGTENLGAGMACFFKRLGCEKSLGTLNYFQSSNKNFGLTMESPISIGIRREPGCKTFLSLLLFVKSKVKKRYICLVQNHNNRGAWGLAVLQLPHSHTCIYMISKIL